MGCGSRRNDAGAIDISVLFTRVVDVGICGATRMSTELIPNTKEIAAFFHCSKCHEANRVQWISAGFTEWGVQIWCDECESNIVHIGFEGQTHPANTTRRKK